MSNPVVTVTNTISAPPAVKQVRKSYTMKSFNSQNFFLYNEGESPSSLSTSDLGMEFYLRYRVGESLGQGSSMTQPTFVTDGGWTSLKAAPSAVITPNYSVMPKLLGPSTLMVDNGITSPDEVFMAYWWDGSVWEKLFNWVMDTFNGTSIGSASTEWYKYGQVGSSFGSQYVSIKAKDDAQGANKMEMHLESPASPPTGDWDNTQLVVGGAFVLMLNIIGLTPGKAGPGGSGGIEQNRWKLTITFGDVTMTIGDASTMNVNIAGDGLKGNDTIVNLAEGAAKEGPPQQGFITDKPPLLIGVYPCWNGIVVTTGQQDSIEVVKTAGTFCRKLKDASIQVAPYSTWFDPADPANVEVGTDSGATVVDFGSRMDVVAENCRFEIAYLPKFFNKSMSFDGFWLLNKDTAEAKYKYSVYSIYTYNNDSDWVLTSPVVTDSGNPGTVPDTSYYYLPWVMKTTSGNHKRYGGEIFGYILKSEETRTDIMKHGNGSFTLTWAGGTPGDPAAADWKKYIKSVSVTIGKDGSSGSITVDKYGVAGQDAVAEQSIGAIVLDVTGGENTVAGTIFEGLGMGVSETDSSGEATWTIPLVGLEQKMDDMFLINPPYMDGEKLSTVVDYLCNYAGLIYDMADAQPNDVLSATNEPNSARFDWKPGTTVKTALDEVMEDTHHWYVVRDGKIFFYKLGVTGLPLTLGPDQSAGYDLTNMVSIDKAPIFDNLRNYIVAFALQKVPDGQGTKTEQIPVWPLVEARTKDTTPDVPWAKSLVKVYPGQLDQADLAKICDNVDEAASVFELTGKQTISGNADIHPYDQWGDLVICSVTHNVDLVSKTWTTDLEFMKAGV